MRYALRALAVVIAIAAACLPALSRPSAELAGSKWKLVSIVEGDMATPVVENTTVTLQFQSDTRVGGSSGCNSYGGNYTINGDKLTVSSVVSTKRACVDPAAMKQEARFFAGLEKAERYEIHGPHLTIHFDGGHCALNFVRA